MAALIVRARTIVTCDTDAPQSRIDFDGLGTIDDGAIAIENGRVVAVGPAVEIARERRSVDVLDLGRSVVVPGLVDAHAHPFFSGDREPDFASRVSGQPPPLGMAYTVERTREALLDPERF